MKKEKKKPRETVEQMSFSSNTRLSGRVRHKLAGRDCSDFQPLAESRDRHRDSRKPSARKINRLSPAEKRIQSWETPLINELNELGEIKCAETNRSTIAHPNLEEDRLNRAISAPTRQNARRSKVQGFSDRLFRPRLSLANTSSGIVSRVIGARRSLGEITNRGQRPLPIITSPSWASRTGVYGRGSRTRGCTQRENC